MWRLEVWLKAWEWHATFKCQAKRSSLSRHAYLGICIYVYKYPPTYLYGIPTCLCWSHCSIRCWVQSCVQFNSIFKSNFNFLYCNLTLQQSRPPLTHSSAVFVYFPMPPWFCVRRNVRFYFPYALHFLHRFLYVLFIAWFLIFMAMLCNKQGRAAAAAAAYKQLSLR